MLSVKFLTFTLSGVLTSVVMLNVVMLNDVILSAWHLLAAAVLSCFEENISFQNCKNLSNAVIMQNALLALKKDLKPGP